MRPRCREKLAASHHLLKGSGAHIVATTPSTPEGGRLMSRFGSKADIGEGATNVRFTPKLGVSCCHTTWFYGRPFAPANLQLRAAAGPWIRVPPARPDRRMGERRRHRHGVDSGRRSDA